MGRLTCSNKAKSEFKYFLLNVVRSKKDGFTEMTSPQFNWIIFCQFIWFFSQSKGRYLIQNLVMMLGYVMRTLFRGYRKGTLIWNELMTNVECCIWICANISEYNNLLHKLPSIYWQSFWFLITVVGTSSTLRHHLVHSLYQTLVLFHLIYLSASLNEQRKI